MKTPTLADVNPVPVLAAMETSKQTEASLVTTCIQLAYIKVKFSAMCTTAALQNVPWIILKQCQGGMPIHASDEDYGEYCSPSSLTCTSYYGKLSGM